MTPRLATIPNENLQVRRAFILGAFIRLSPAFLLSAPARSANDSFDDSVTATRSYCMGDELDNRAAESAWHELTRTAARSEPESVSRLAGAPAANDVASRVAA